jgi:hypothetical protein
MQAAEVFPLGCALQSHLREFKEATPTTLESDNPSFSENNFLIRRVGT